MRGKTRERPRQPLMPIAMTVFNQVGVLIPPDIYKRELFWNTEALEFDDLPTLQMVLKEASTDVLGYFLLENKPAYSEMVDVPVFRDSGWEHGAYGSAISAMRRVKVCPSPDFVGFPRGFISYEPGKWLEAKMEYGLAFFSNEQVDRWRDLRERWLNKRELTLASDLHSVRWKEALGYRVWLGDYLSVAQLYACLADAVRDLVYFGLDEETHDKNLVKNTKKFHGGVYWEGGAKTETVDSDLPDEREFYKENDEELKEGSDDPEEVDAPTAIKTLQVYRQNMGEAAYGLDIYYKKKYLPNEAMQGFVDDLDAINDKYMAPMFDAMGHVSDLLKKGYDKPW